MRFEWDENKNNINILKHGIDFRDAKNAFEYPIIVKEDIRHEYGEKRFIAIGLLLPEYIYSNSIYNQRFGYTYNFSKTCKQKRKTYIL